MEKNDLISRGYILGKAVAILGSTSSMVSTWDIVNAPAVESEPVRHGSWKYDPDAIDYNIGGWVCNLCGVRNNNIGTMPNMLPLRFSGSRYCPNCGAKMDLEG